MKTQGAAITSLLYPGDGSKSDVSNKSILETIAGSKKTGLIKRNGERVGCLINGEMEPVVLQEDWTSDTKTIKVKDDDGGILIVSVASLDELPPSDFDDEQEDERHH